MRPQIKMAKPYLRYTNNDGRADRAVVSRAGDHRDGADRALEPCQTRQKARETPGDIISDARGGGGVWSLERHASQALEAAQVLDLPQVSEAMIQAHVADGVADRHLAHGLDGGGPLKRFVV